MHKVTVNESYLIDFSVKHNFLMWHTLFIDQVSQWMVGVKRLINELKLSEKPPPSSPKSLFSPDACSSLSDSQLPNEEHVGSSATSASPSSSPLAALPVQHQQNPSAEGSDPKDLCMNTDNFSSLKPVLMPEIFMSGEESVDKPDELQRGDNASIQGH